MRVLGKVVALTDGLEGQSQNGQFWSKRTLVIETTDDRPKKLAFEVFGDDRVKWLKPLKAGDMVEVSFVVESHKYGDKWFTRLSAMGLKVYESGKLQ